MDQVGKVLHVKDGIASLDVKRISSCGSSCGSCSAHCDVEGQRIDVIDTLNVDVGDYVEISTDTSRVFKYMLMLYGIPLVFLITGFVVSYNLFIKYDVANYELYSFLVGLISMVVAGFILRQIDKSSKVQSFEINQMVKKL